MKEPIMITSTTEELLRAAKEAWEKMTLEEQKEMSRKQAEGWVKSEAQWAKDFREGKCKRD